MSAEELKSIKERLDKVSSGTWTPYVEGRDFTSGSSFIMVEDGDNRKDDIEIIGASAADIDFIGNAKRDMLLLIKEIERLNKSR